jgi:uncharacterized membrane protein
MFPSSITEQRTLENRQYTSTNWVRVLAIICIAIGIFFRFTNLDLKPYWFDEASASLQLSGYSDQQVMQEITTGQIIYVSDLVKYQSFNADKPLTNTLNGLAKKEPQLTPLYFIVARFWMQWFGSSVVVIRSLSAVISLMVLLLVYWLCIELFKSSNVAWIATAMVALSPFHLIYAQEARPPALWAVMILLSSIALLRAMRLGGLVNWLLYAVTISLGFYTFLLSALVFVGHAIYCFITERFRFTKLFRSYLFASTVGFSSFLPWIFTAILPNRFTDGLAVPSTLPTLVKAWIRNLSLPFVDFSLNETDPKLYFVSYLGIVLLILGALLVAAYAVYKSTNERVWLFLLVTGLFPLAVLIISDLCLSTSRSTVGRYSVPSVLAAQLVMAYFLTEFVASFQDRVKWLNWQRLGLVGILSVGLLSCLAYSQSEFWWSKAGGNDDRTIAAFINQSQQPLVVSSSYFVNILSLSHSLRPDVQLLIAPEASVPRIPETVSPSAQVFLYRPSLTVLSQFEKASGLQLIQKDLLWKIQNVGSRITTIAK